MSPANKVKFSFTRIGLVSMNCHIRLYSQRSFTVSYNIYKYDFQLLWLPWKNLTGGNFKKQTISFFLASLEGIRVLNCCSFLVVLKLTSSETAGLEHPRKYYPCKPRCRIIFWDAITHREWGDDFSYICSPMNSGFA